jgi:hypothetical protein
VGLVVYVRNDPVNLVDPDGHFPIPAIPGIIVIGGAVIGGVAGGIDAYWADEPMARAIMSGAIGGVAGAATLTFGPYTSGAAAGFASSLASHAYEWLIGNQPFSWSDINEMVMDAAVGAVMGRAIGDPMNARYRGLISARRGRNPQPFRTSIVGPKTRDVFRAQGLGTVLGGSYSRLRSGVGLGGGGSDDSPFGTALAVVAPPAPLEADSSDLFPTIADLAYQSWMRQSNAEASPREEVTTRIIYTGPVIINP